MRRVLVTGAGGALGRAVIHRLHKLGGYRIFASDRQLCALDHVMNFSCDVCSREALAAVLDSTKPDWVFHLAATFSNDFDQAYATNVASSRHLLEIVHAGGMKPRVLLIGSAAEYGAVAPAENPVKEDRSLAPVSIYGVSKAWQTQLVSLYASRGVDVVCARIFNLYGPGMSARLFPGRLQQQMDEISAGKRFLVEVGPLTATRDYLSTDRAAAQILAIAHHADTGGIYHVASGEPITIRDFMKQQLMERGMDLSIVREAPAQSNHKGLDVSVIFADITRTKHLMRTARENVKLKLTVVTPVFNEEQVIAQYHLRTRQALDSLDAVEATILFVMDRCTDDTLDILRQIVANDPKSKVITLSSRFGHQMSLLAGIEHATDADVIVMMDSDLQHPPEIIPQLISKFREGADVVYTLRRNTNDIGLIRRFIGNLFYRLLGFLSKIPINPNAADFRLISKRVAATLTNDFHERNMFLRGLFSWMGFKQTSVNFVAERRFAGKSKYSFSAMMQLALAGILSFSIRPLHAGIFVGIGFASLAFLYIVFAVITFFVARSVPSGWTSMVALLLLFSGVQLIVVGILGTYIGGIYEEVKRRPHYIIDEVISHHD